MLGYRQLLHKGFWSRAPVALASKQHHSYSLKGSAFHFTTLAATATEEEKKPYYITTPIYYVNAVPHLGHLYTSVLADTIKRYQEVKGNKVVLCTGTDEHGLKIQQAAAKDGLPPQEFCDKVSVKFKELCDVSNVQYTDFIRTTEKRHKLAVAEIWKTLMDKGFIYKGSHEGWYSISDEAFYPATQVTESVDPKTGESFMVAAESGSRVEWTTEENYKFKLPLLRDKLLAWLKENPEVIYPSSRHNEVVTWLENGVSDLSVSRPRSRLDWGISVPNDPEHTIYVWLDALTNYLTVTGYPWTGDQIPTQMKQGGYPADVHIIGKDILRFHAIYWPAFLMAAELPLPKRILSHAHWTMGKQKMSKSRGNVVDPTELIQRVGLDPVRYFLMRDGGITNDGDYTDENIMTRYKKDLAGQLGNLMARSTSKTLNITETIPSVQIPQSLEEVDPRDQALHKALMELPALYEQNLDTFETGRGLSAVFEMIAEANKHFGDNAPWNLVKQPSESARLQTVLRYSYEALRTAGILLQPVMPEKSQILLNKLAVPPSERSFKHSSLGMGWKTSVPLGPDCGVLFPRL
ncbi:methionyl-tRNA synthetase [Basidiobolus meristosporus CBS 931.73]|uniref:Probable methionine--tRNA ligase, mitochondrial n=1 Tax=Basidiobolus meristosporus CBS 931.73 TaxID=1314790 RepID=A0A1Y1Y761_9FUNG|nr:methionyl-tRNA synthetase [Basidiobolus meristosporus CBS 931.73]|eukprot:ORX93566.1 methionyl-tRNA synthetase [Basidiobolus meristosporus CBS 931.73]